MTIEKKSVYISFDSSDKRAFRKIKTYLDRCGILVNYDQNRLRSFIKKKRDSIPSLIMSCDFFIFLVSNAAMNNKIVVSELKIAVDFEIKFKIDFILVCKLDNLSLAAELEKKIFANFTNEAEFVDEIEKLIKSIKQKNPSKKINSQYVAPSSKFKYKKEQGIELVLIEPGNFTMGSSNLDGPFDELPIHTVYVKKSFWISIYPIRQQIWADVMGKLNVAYYNPHLPINNISWYEAIEFIKRLNYRDQHSYLWDLPTEEEWEYCARAGTESEYFWGNNIEKLEKYAWYRKNSKKQIHPIGELLPNPWGLYDILGNVYEWCKTSYFLYSDKINMIQKDNIKLSHENKTLRGGAYTSTTFGCRVSSRSRQNPHTCYSWNGIRVVLRNI